MPGDIAEGTDVIGLKLKPRYAPLVFILENNDYDKQNVDIFIASNLWTVEASYDSDGNVCSGLLVDPRPMPWGMITVKFSTGSSSTVPVDKITGVTIV